MRQQSAMIDNIRLRVSTDEKRQLEQLARQRGVSISTLIRESLPLDTQRAAA